MCFIVFQECESGSHGARANRSSSTSSDHVPEQQRDIRWWGEGNFCQGLCYKWSLLPSVLVPLNTRQLCYSVMDIYLCCYFFQMWEWLTFVDWGIKSWCILMPLTVTKVRVSSLQRRVRTIETDSVHGYEKLDQLDEFWWCEVWTHWNHLNFTT